MPSTTNPLQSAGPEAQRLKEEKEAVIVTKTSELIVTELAEGPCTARDLSQRLELISHSNIRQTLLRLVKTGIVTKLRRGVYGIRCDIGAEVDCDTAAYCAVTDPIVTNLVLAATDCDMLSPVAAAFADYAALDDPSNPEAWA
jgi:DNA-binding transcriptional ArsR family regulator